MVVSEGKRLINVSCMILDFGVVQPSLLPRYKLVKPVSKTSFTLQPSDIIVEAPSTTSYNGSNSNKNNNNSNNCGTFVQTAETLGPLCHRHTDSGTRPLCYSSSPRRHQRLQPLVNVIRIATSKTTTDFLQIRIGDLRSTSNGCYDQSSQRIRIKLKLFALLHQH